MGLGDSRIADYFDVAFRLAAQVLLHPGRNSLSLRSRHGASTAPDRMVIGRRPSSRSSLNSRETPQDRLPLSVESLQPGLRTDTSNLKAVLP